MYICVHNLNNMNLSPKGIQALENNHRLRYLLAAELEVHIISIERWIARNDDNLTKAAVLNIIHKETGIPISELLQEKQPA